MTTYINFPSKEKQALNPATQDSLEQLFQQLDTESDVTKHVAIYQKMLALDPTNLPARLGLAKLTGKTEVATIRQFRDIFESEKHKRFASNVDDQFDYYMVTLALVNEYLMADMPRAALVLLQSVEVMSEHFDQVVPYLIMMCYCLLQDVEQARVFLETRKALQSHDACVFMMVLLSIIVDDHDLVQTWLKRLKALNPTILTVLKQPEDIFELVLTAEELEGAGFEAVPGTASQLAHVLYDFDLYGGNMQYVHDYFDTVLKK